MAEEDAVLLEHVRLHGPCNWSSIRSNGLLLPPLGQQAQTEPQVVNAIPVLVSISVLVFCVKFLAL
jgi:hypothetical protein